MLGLRLYTNEILLTYVVVFEGINKISFVGLMVHRATSSFGLFDVLNREDSQSSAIMAV